MYEWLKNESTPPKKIFSGFNAALKVMSISGGAITSQKYKLERGYQRLLNTYLNILIKQNTFFYSRFIKLKY